MPEPNSPERTSPRISLVEGTVVIGVLGSLIFSGVSLRQGTVAKQRAFVASQEAFVASQEALVANQALLGVSKYAGDSPIKVVGGSMTFRSQQQWIAVGATSYYAPISDSSQIQLERFTFTPKVAAPTFLTIFPGPKVSWKIVINARNTTGDAGVPSRGAVVYTKTDDVPTCDGAPSAGPVTTICLDPMGGTLKTNLLNDLTTYYGIRYNDDPRNFTEHIWSVTITVGTSSNTFYCLDGECRVYIGARQTS